MERRMRRWMGRHCCRWPPSWSVSICLYKVVKTTPRASRMRTKNNCRLCATCERRLKMWIKVYRGDDTKLLAARLRRCVPSEQMISATRPVFFSAKMKRVIGCILIDFSNTTLLPSIVIDGRRHVTTEKTKINYRDCLLQRFLSQANKQNTKPPFPPPPSFPFPLSPDLPRPYKCQIILAPEVLKKKPQHK